MPSNIALLYSGTAAESPAVQFSGWLATGLDLNAECSFARDSLAALTPAERQNYRALLELGGWNEAQEFLVVSSRTPIDTQSRTAHVAFQAINTTGQISWASPLELTAKSDEALSTLAYTSDLVITSFALMPGVLDAAMRLVLVHAGAPLAVIAHAPRSTAINKATIVVAWKPAAATRRAIQHALPILREAAHVYLVAIEGPTHPPLQPSAQTMGNFLREQHNVNAEICVLHEADSPEAQLSDFYHAHEADVLVMGAYSQSRLQTLLFGSFVKHFMARGDCNVLLVH